MDLPYAVYILKCSNGQHYTGYTEDINKRLLAHSKEEVHFTKDKLPGELFIFHYFLTRRRLVILNVTSKQVREQLLETNASYNF